MLAQSVEFDCQIQYMSIDFSRDTNSVHLIRSCSFAIIFNPLIFPKPCLTFLSPPHQLSLIDSCQEEQSPSNPIESVCHYFQPPPLLFKITSLGANSTRGGGGGTPGNSCMVGVCRPVLQVLTLFISDQKMLFFTHVFRPDL